MSWGMIWFYHMAAMFLDHYWMWEMYQLLLMTSTLGSIAMVTAPICLFISWTSNELDDDHPWASEWDWTNSENEEHVLGVWMGVTFQWLLTAGHIYMYSWDLYEWIDNKKNYEPTEEELAAEPVRPEKESFVDFASYEDEESDDDDDAASWSDSWAIKY